LSDLAALRAVGWDIDILAHARRGGWVLGLCGGYQMLGRRIADPLGLEGPPGEAAGLGLLEIDTVLEPAKVLARRERRCALTGEPAKGYEIHMGRTTGPGLARPLLHGEEGADGAMSTDGRVLGCYLHGLLAADGYRAALLDRIRTGAGARTAYEASVDSALDALAEHLERCLDLDRLLRLSLQPTG
jgi:adenosylcobyric acid synthase